MSTPADGSSRRGELAWTRDLLPAAVATVVVSYVVSRHVRAAHGLWLVLVVIGAAAIAAAAYVAERVEGAATHPSATGDADPGSAPAAQAATLMATGTSTDQQLAAPRRAAASPAERSIETRPITWTAAAVRGIHGPMTTLTVPKLGNSDGENEDAFSADAERGRIVVSDGASSSFASREWSRALCDELLDDAASIESLGSFRTAVARAAERWRTAVTPTGEVAWWAQQGLERGAFATVLAVDIASLGRSTRWRAAAVGDSCVVQLRQERGGWRIVSSFPMPVGEKFTSYPDLVQTADHEAIEGLQWAEGEIAAGDIIVVATDAVAEWALSQDDPAIPTLLAEASPDELVATFTRLRETNEMVNDDCTLVRVMPGRRPR